MESHGRRWSRNEKLWRGTMAFLTRILWVILSGYAMWSCTESHFILYVLATNQSRYEFKNLCSCRSMHTLHQAEFLYIKNVSGRLGPVFCNNCSSSMNDIRSSSRKPDGSVLKFATRDLECISAILYYELLLSVIISSNHFPQTVAIIPIVIPNWCNTILVHSLWNNINNVSCWTFKRLINYQIVVFYWLFANRTNGR